MLRKLIMMFAILLVPVITGCSNNGKFVSKSSTNQCGGHGWTHAIVHYGDSRVVVVPLSDVRAGQEMRFFLIPLNSLTSFLARVSSSLVLSM